MSNINKNNINNNIINNNNINNYTAPLTQLLPDNIKNKRITRLTIDSSYRNKNPKNILEPVIYQLPSNPFYFMINSDILTIYHPNHNFKVNDKIIIQNLLTKDFFFTANHFILIPNSYYIRIYHPNYKLFIGTANDTYITINNIIGTTDESHIGNIPINLINTNI